MIRLLQPEDAEACVALRRVALFDAPWAFSADPDNDRGSDVVETAKSLARDGFAAAGAEEDGRLMAIAVAVRDPSPKRPHLALIFSVFCRPEARGRGLAREVSKLAIATARSWPGVESIALSVSSGSPAAKHLYESLGFVEWGHEPDAMRINGRSYDEIHMRLRF